jgi:hypothetical protein
MSHGQINYDRQSSSFKTNRSKVASTNLASAIGTERRENLKKIVESGPSLGVGAVARVGAGVASRVAPKAVVAARNIAKGGSQEIASRFRRKA